MLRKKNCGFTLKESAELEDRREKKKEEMIQMFNKIVRVVKTKLRVTFQRFPHSLHRTNVVIGSSALRVCTFKHTPTSDFNHSDWLIKQVDATTAGR